MDKFFVIITVLSFAFGVFPTTAFAQNCKQLYGGGITTEQYCEGKQLTVPTKTVAKATPTPVKKSTTSKGGLPVVSPTPLKTTPSTGPELLGLLGLVPAAGLGYYLRRKS